MFRAEEERLKQIFYDQWMYIEHIGSTVIPGIKAKPIIDILVEIQDLDQIDRFIPAMEAYGYEYRAESGLPGRQYFRKEPDKVRGYHVHVYQAGHENIVLKLNFRDYLRTHPKRAQLYSQLKEELASKFRDDRAMYGKAKSGFIEETNVLAARWRTLKK
jgi:GrpB-like predicted nucleotidyltransferase (UPF0157 family)